MKNENEDNDYFIEDILNIKKSNKKDSGKIGKRGERELKKIFNKRFPDKNFYRTIGSGNRYSQVNLSEEHKSAFVGDLVCNSNFKFTIECKFGYNDIELSDVFEKGNKKINEFLKQTEKDSKQINKFPL